MSDTSDDAQATPDDTGSETGGRRRFFRAAAGAAAGGAALLAGSKPASAAAGQPVIQGQTSSVGRAQTTITSTMPVPNGTLRADNTGHGHGVLGITAGPEPAGVYGRNHDGTGVHGVGIRAVEGTGTQTGVWGRGETGVVGEGDGVGVLASLGSTVGTTEGPGSALWAEVNTFDHSAGSIAVRALAKAGGTAVHASVDTSWGKGTGGTGVRIDAPTAIEATGAVVVRGAVSLSTSGIATVASGQANVNVTSPVPLTATSKILATAQTAGGTVRAATQVSTTVFRIHLTGPATQNVKVAWLVLQ